MPTSAMPSLKRALVMSALVPVGVTTGNNVVSLSSFTPRIENLPSQCQDVYTRAISGCSKVDFTGKKCSAPCLDGLVEISRAVEQACGTVDVPETSIIGVFLLGQGVQALCPGVEVTTIAPSSTQPPQQQPPSSTSAQEASLTSATEATSSSGLVIDPNAPTGSATLATSVANTPANSQNPPPSSSTALPSQTGDNSRANSESGGGSPFDVLATGSGSHVQRLGTYALASILGTALLFTAFL